MTQQKTHYLRNVHVHALESLGPEFLTMVEEEEINDPIQLVYMAGMVDVESWDLINRVMGK